MHWLERKFIKIRHTKFLKPMEGLWGSVRPVYDFFCSVCFKNGLKRRLNCTDMILVAAECRGVQEVYEPDVWTHVMQRVKSGYRIADVGANIGLYAMALGTRVGDEGALFAFEPDQDSFKILIKNISLNRLERIVTIIPMAVSDQRGEVVFQAGAGTESRLIFNEGPEDRGASIRVKCTTLDDFFSEGSLDLLKIDVEGFEQQVLIGGKDLLSDPKRGPQHIYVEVHPFAWQQTNTTSEALLSLLRGYGYEVYCLDGRRVEKITHYGEIYCVRG